MSPPEPPYRRHPACVFRYPCTPGHPPKIIAYCNPTRGLRGPPLRVPGARQWKNMDTVFEPNMLAVHE